MKIVFYENPKRNELWFTGRKAELTTGKAFFSNSKQWVEDFKNKDIEELKSLVRIWLPPIESLSPRNEDNIILYIPFGMQEMFSLILEKLGFKTKRGEVSSVPTSKELGLGTGEERTTFYDNIVTKEILITGTKCMAIDTSKDIPLQARMDEITNEPNEIDAVFVAKKVARDFCVVAKSNLSNDSKRRTDAEDMNKCLTGLKDIPQISEIRRGDLDYVLFQLTDGIVCMSIIPGTEAWLGFISATDSGVNRMLSYRDGYLNELHDLAISHCNL